jgi:hypothetical protein
MQRVQATHMGTLLSYLALFYLLRASLDANGDPSASKGYIRTQIFFDYAPVRVPRTLLPDACG